MSILNAFGVIDEQILEVIKDIIEVPISILSSGCATLAGACLGIWGFYRCYLIMAGYEASPFLPFIKDLLIKAFILIIVISNSLLKEYVVNPLVSFPENLAVDFKNTLGSNSGNKYDITTKSIFSNLDSMLTETMTLLNNPVLNKDNFSANNLTGDKKKQYDDLSKKIMDLKVQRAEELREASKKYKNNTNERKKEYERINKKFENTCKGILNSIGNTVGLCSEGSIIELENQQAEIVDEARKELSSNSGGMIDELIEFLTRMIKAGIVMAGFLILSIACLITVIPTQVFFHLCLAVSPLFIFFSAWEKTRGWTSSWLNTTLGYCFTYPMVLIAVGGLLGAFKKMVFDEGAYSQLFSAPIISWLSVVSIFLLCLLFAKLIPQISSLATSLFSGGDLSSSITSPTVSKFVGSPLKDKGSGGGNNGNDGGSRAGVVGGMTDKVVSSFKSVANGIKNPQIKNGSTGKGAKNQMGANTKFETEK